MTDPIADYLTRLRNAIQAKHRVVEVPASNLKKEITKILFEKGYILNYKFVEDGPQGTIKIALKYDAVNKVNAIKKLIRISTPGMRKYTGYKDMPRVINGLGINVSDDNKVTVKGPKGEMSQTVDPSIKVNIADGEVTFEIVEENDTVETKQKQAFHGLYRSLINNMVVGVSEGYKKEMELVGVGYRVSNQGNLLEFALGYTHPILLQLPSEIKVETKSERNQNPLIILESCDKQLLGQVCAKIRSFRKPEPYKGKGILFVGEQIRRKSGKSAGAK